MLSVIGCTSVGPVVQPIETPEPEPREFVISVTATAGGTVEPNGIVRVQEGDSVEIQIAPNRGFVLQSVVFDGETQPSEDRVDLSAVSSDHTVHVEFREEKTCLVLSVGGVDGLSHLGAIDALTGYVGQEIHYVFGNSMGSLIGALYASAPDVDGPARYKAFMAEYVRATHDDKKQSATAGALLGGLSLLALSGGTLGWGAVAGAVAGAAAGSANEPLMSQQRLAETLDGFLESVDIEHTPVPFGTSYFMHEGEGVVRVVATEGNAAEAVSRSVNNPYMFEGTDLSFVDPGMDRMSAVPIEEAFSAFQPDRIIAINTTGAPAVFSANVSCPVEEIAVELIPDINAENALRGEDPDFFRLYDEGKYSVLFYYHDLGVIPLLE